MKTTKPLFIACLLLAACQPAPKDPDITGRWLGPEGTYMEITQNVPNAYKIAIKDLDGVTVYDAIPAPGGIQFTRGDMIHTLHRGTGQQTGMKWLADKKDCMIVVTGEGYCRD